MIDSSPFPVNSIAPIGARNGEGHGPLQDFLGVWRPSFSLAKLFHVGVKNGRIRLQILQVEV